MSDVEILEIPRTVTRRLCAEAEKLGITVVEYLVDLLVQGLDPVERAREYAEAARELLNHAEKEIEQGNVRQAAEKLWGATALAVKAYIAWREGRRIVSHRELWEHKDKLARELGEWVYNAWNAGNSMHTCFYEGWCTREHVENSARQVEKLVEEVYRKIRQCKSPS